MALNKKIPKLWKTILLPSLGLALLGGFCWWAFSFFWLSPPRALAQTYHKDVAFYYGAGSKTSFYDQIAKTLDELANETGLTWETIEEDEVKGNANDPNGVLLASDGSPRFGAIIFPGGSSNTTGANLGPAGRENVRTFVKNGGNYVSVCAGTFLASLHYSKSQYDQDGPNPNYLHLWPGIAYSSNWGDRPDYELDPNHPMNQGFNGWVDDVHYGNSPQDFTDNVPDTEYIATYRNCDSRAEGNEAVIVYKENPAAGRKGRMVMSGAHPERFESTRPYFKRMITYALENRPGPSPTPSQSPSPTPTASPPACETRGAWLNQAALENATIRQTTIENIKKANLNTVFLIAPPIGSNRGDSTPENFAAMLNLAKTNSLSVHAWMINLYRTGTQVDFRNPAEREAQVQWAAQLLTTYPALDGLQLDYIRYQPEQYPNREKIEAVNATVEAIYQKMKADFPGKILSAAVVSFGQECVVFSGPDYTPEQDNVWNTQVPDWFKEWFAAHPDNRWDRISWPQGKFCQKAVPQGMIKQQDPITWLKNDSLDQIISMSYDAGVVDWWLEEIDILKNILSFLGVSSPASRAYMGIGWYQDDQYTQENLQAIVAKIKGGRARGLNGVSFFEFSRSKNQQYANDLPLINALTLDAAINNYDPPFKNSAVSCLASQGGSPYDLNGDNRTSAADLKIILQNSGSTTFSRGDFNQDGKVNGFDFFILSQKLSGQN